MRRSQAGLTLIEVLVVLAIVAIMSGSAVMVLPRDAAPSGLENAARGLTQDLRNTAEATASRAVPVQFEWTQSSYHLTAGSRTLTRELPAGVVLTADLAAPYLVSAVGVPSRLVPLHLTLSGVQRDIRLQFDGLTVTDLTGGVDAPK